MSSDTRARKRIFLTVAATVGLLWLAWMIWALVVGPALLHVGK